MFAKFNYFVILLISISVIGISTTLTSQIFAFSKELFNNDNKTDESAIALLRTVVSVAWVGSPILGSYLQSKYGFLGLFIGCTLGYVIALVVLIFYFGKKYNEAKNIAEEYLRLKI